MVSAGAVPPLEALLRSADGEAQWHAAATLGNSVNAQNKGKMVSEGAVELLSAVFGNSTEENNLVAGVAAGEAAEKIAKMMGA